jgi:hypothetical protein
MKLIYCRNCHFMFSLQESDRFQWCKCGDSGGRYINDINAEFTGRHAVPIGIDNSTLVEAMFKNNDITNFKAFVIDDATAPTFKRLKPKKRRYE